MLQIQTTLTLHSGTLIRGETLQIWATLKQLSKWTTEKEDVIE